MRGFLASLFLLAQVAALAQGATNRNASVPSVEDWQNAFIKADEFVSQLNLTEKIGMITGTMDLTTSKCIGNIKPIDRINFPGLCLLDGPQALNHADLVSIFSSGLTAAATWDKDLIFERGKALGEEFRGKGGHVLLGPVVGPLGRHALGGRNWEGFSPDPYLTGRAMESTIQGIQSVGIQACAKHFIGNEQETQRSNSFAADGTEIDAISSNIDDRTLHEVYLWPFADSVRAGVTSFMCSYNRINQTYACENDVILKDILRNELGFRGYVMSDWLATHSGVKSINAGLDLNMPGAIDAVSLLTGASYWGSNITKYVDDGSVTEKRIDDMVRKIMAPYYLLGQDSSDYPSIDPSLLLTLAASFGYELPNIEIPSRDVQGDHASLIREMASEGTVLLKNTDSILPLQSPKTIGVFGNDAADPTDGLTYDEAYEIGTIDIGGGSGTGRHVYVVSPLEAVRAQAKKIGARLQYIIHNKILAANNFVSLYPTPEICLVFLGTFASEGWDRTSYEADWNSTLVVENVAKKCPNTIVITHSAGINTMPWANNENVKAIIAAHLPGQESGNSIVDILWGNVNPSAKLPYSIPVNETDYDIPIVNLTDAEVTSPDAWQADFTEGQFIDYRHLDANDIEPRYEFGFGLSYTTFKLQSKLTVKKLVKKLTARPAKTKVSTPGGNSNLWETVVQVHSKVTNTGPVAGATVPQLYVAFPQSGTPTGTPVQVLRGFEKIFLEPGESEDVVFELRRRDVSYWDVELQNWVIPKGSFGFRVGLSSRDIKSTKSVVLRA
ncbi:glycosyl hydrolase family 3 N terminal domain-containing protein [Dactylonectria estremocensis]|uniref:Beta-glucosidase cel3A n=1 Tax=Dactylonectria estremocensis TaxID=1079267 RepID=A0A9P9EUH5_9HYPO|nr:glycosyl hydrolase family 3 N terminal domain-containing protein [Dactylonectria estremocensis]